MQRLNTNIAFKCLSHLTGTLVEHLSEGLSPIVFTSTVCRRINSLTDIQKYIPISRELAENTGNRIDYKIKSGAGMGYEEAKKHFEDRWKNEIKANLFYLIFMFENELSRVPSFVIEGPVSYDIDVLMDGGAGLLPSELVHVVPEAAHEMDQLGKAMGCKLWTAASFHCFRILELTMISFASSKILDYETKAPRNKSIGPFLQFMENQGVLNDKLKAQMKYISEHFRNPTIHPEMAIEEEEFFGSYGAVRTAVATMVSELGTREQNSE